MTADPHGWNHAQCNPCWLSSEGPWRIPHRLVERTVETCCYCGRQTGSGIYRRARTGDIDTLPHCPDIGLDVTVFS